MKKIKILLCFLFLFLCACEHKISDSSQDARVAFDQPTVSELYSKEQLMEIGTKMYPEMYKEWFSFISSNRYYDNQKFKDKYIYKIERDSIQSMDDIRNDYYSVFSKRYDFPFDLDLYKNVYEEKKDGLYAHLTWNNPSNTIYFPGEIVEIQDDLVIYKIYCEDETTTLYDTNQTFSLVYSQEKWIYGTFFNEKENDVSLGCKFPTGKYTALKDTSSYKFAGSNEKVTKIDENRKINIVLVKRHIVDGINASYWGKCKNGSWVCLADKDGVYFEIMK